jgi:hypothetical protein
MFERTSLETDAGLEDIVAKLAYRFFSGVPGDLFRSPVERRDYTPLIYGKDSICDTLEDQPRKGSILFG